MSLRARVRSCLWSVALVASLGTATAQAEALRLLHRNPRYLEHRGEPTILITSAERHGAVLNLDFDFVPYLDELARNRLNLTRIFSGVYVEDGQALGKSGSTLAPRSGRLLAPWARSDQPGYAGGGNKFDLSRWDPAYLQRLRRFLTEAARRRIVVELVLFCPFYEDSLWALSPLHPRNNVNGVGARVTDRKEAYSGKHADLQAVQEALVRKLVRELNGFDDLYFEICNEPYTGAAVPSSFQDRIADVIVATEKDLPKRHLIARNVANGSRKIETPHPAISIFNFHYASPPDAVTLNGGLAKVIADDETGFRGTADEPYRREAWQFLLAGGAIFDHLDYSFTTEHERGTAPIPPGQPGGGGRAFRQQMRILRGFVERFDFAAMKPSAAPFTITTAGEAGPGAEPALEARALVGDGAWVAYLSVPPPRSAEYAVRWTGTIEPALSETYTLHTRASDGIRLWLDGKLLIDDWTEHGPTERAAQVELVAGRRVPIKLEYFQAGGAAEVQLAWSTPSLRREIVPASALRQSDGEREGLRGEYFLDRVFQRRAFVRADATVSFDWTVASPFVSTAPTQAFASPALQVAAPAGRYDVEWLDPRSGAVLRRNGVEAEAGALRLTAPSFTFDVALSIRRRR
jgi:hypothetical protein